MRTASLYACTQSVASLFKCDILIIRRIYMYTGGEILIDASSPAGVKTTNNKVLENSGLDEKS